MGTTTPAALLEVNGTAKFDGTVTFAGGETYTGNVTTNDQLVSTVATGTAPLKVTSTTQVANLNASLLGGMAASAFATTGANTFNGTQTINSNLIVAYPINDALVLQGNVTDSNTGWIGSNVIGGYTGGYNPNTVTNSATGASIGGGGGVIANYQYPNIVDDDFGTVSGGAGNTAGGGNGTGLFAAVAGGYSNTASGYASTVAGGYGNTAGGDYSFAGGSNANASDAGSFVWCQQDGYACNSKGINSFVVSADGPIYFYDRTGNQGCYLSTGAGSWSCSSDRNLKNNIVPIDSRSVLNLVTHLPISQWSMKADAAGHKHIGPMAQDFFAAFGLGDTDKYIAQGDAQGVALASIQGLYQVMQEKLQQKDEEIEALKTRLHALEDRLSPK
ncbi:MAG: tail fiber domain-containing protein [Bryobacteraceae bacterium]